MIFDKDWRERRKQLKENKRVIDAIYDTKEDCRILFDKEKKRILREKEAEKQSALTCQREKFNELTKRLQSKIEYLTNKNDDIQKEYEDFKEIKDEINISRRSMTAFIQGLMNKAKNSMVPLFQEWEIISTQIGMIMDKFEKFDKNKKQIGVTEDVSNEDFEIDKLSKED